MRNTRTFDKHSRLRWRAWLAQDRVAISTTAFAAKLVLPDTEKDSQPRAMVIAWRAGKRTPQAGMAWSAGEVLRNEGYPDSGAASLFAAGYYTEFAGLLRSLVQAGGRGLPLAQDLFACVPLVVEYALDSRLKRKASRMERTLPKYQPARFDHRLWSFSKLGEFVKDARERLELTQADYSFIATTWKHENETEPLGRAARQIAEADARYFIPALAALKTMQPTRPSEAWLTCLTILDNWLGAMPGSTSGTGHYHNYVTALEQILAQRAHS